MYVYLFQPSFFLRKQLGIYKRCLLFAKQSLVDWISYLLKLFFTEVLESLFAVNDLEFYLPQMIYIYKTFWSNTSILMYSHDCLATDSCRDGWNVRNRSKILNSVGESVNCVLLVFVLLLSKHNYVILFWTKSIVRVFVAEST